MRQLQEAWLGQRFVFRAVSMDYVSRRAQRRFQFVLRLGRFACRMTETTLFVDNSRRHLAVVSTSMCAALPNGDMQCISFSDQPSSDINSVRFRCVFRFFAVLECFRQEWQQFGEFRFSLHRFDCNASILQIQNCIVQKVLTMASITFRNLDDDVKTRLRKRAAGHGRWMEEEARSILADAVGREAVPAKGLGTTLFEHFKPFGGVELELPPREPMRESPRIGCDGNDDRAGHRRRFRT